MALHHPPLPPRLPPTPACPPPSVSAAARAPAIVPPRRRNFHGNGCTWIDQYYADWYNMDRSVHSAYFRLVADKRHTFPGPYQEAGKGARVRGGRESRLPRLGRGCRAAHRAQRCTEACQRPAPPRPAPPAAAGSSVAWGRDQDVTLDFPTLAKVLERVARGQLECSAANQEERTLFMTDPDM